MRILVVEDDPLLGDGIKAGLAQAGFTVDWVKDGVAGELALRTEFHAAVVLDLGLPRLAGLEVLRRMRAEGNKTPVLILTARDAIEDRIKGLDSGADDYMVKPFDLHELAARLRALIRRSAGEAAPVLRVRRHRAGSGRAPGAVQRQARRAAGAGICAAPRFDAQRGESSDARAAIGAAVCLGRRGRKQRHRRPHPSSAPEARAPADPHGARRGLSHAARAEWIAARRIH